jgi:hypothetical protein
MVLAAVESKNRAIDILVRQGVPYEMADEMTRGQYTLLPEEDGVSPEAPASEGYKLAREANRLRRETL